MARRASAAIPRGGTRATDNGGPAGTELTSLFLMVRGFNRARKWKRFHDPRSLALAICSESGELAHVLRWRHEGARRLPKDVVRSVPGEIADVMIFALCLCDELELDPDKIVRAKLAKNSRRPQVAPR